MANAIDTVENLTIGTTAKDIAVNFRAFYIANNSANTVYIKEKAFDGKNCTTSNGFPIAPGAQTEAPFRAQLLSVVASAASTNISLLYVTEEL